ncbi:MAG: hypothetical protein M3Z28_12210 [Candidatus Dormibacteraeota bacterium]|nr:hypothetical protein [Candidatus Dormibacteraeota bacterium]
MIKLPIAALVVIIGLLGGFYGGYKVGGGGTTAAAAATTGARTAGNGLGGGRGTGACPSPAASASGVARRGATGTIVNLTGNSLTIHDTRCNTDVKVTFDPSVIVRKTVVGQASDLQESETVTVTGTRQADGSVKANSINIVPAGSGGFGGLGGGGANGG